MVNRYAGFLIVLFLIVAPAFGQSTFIINPYIGGDGGGGSSCDTLGQYCTVGTSIVWYDVGGGPAYQYVATTFTKETTRTICKASFLTVWATATQPGFNVRAAFYTTSGTPAKPDTIIGDWSDWVNGEDIGDNTWTPFTGLSESLTDGVTYAIVLQTSDTDPTNYFKARGSSGCTPTYVFRSSDGSSWTVTSSTRGLNYAISY